MKNQNTNHAKPVLQAAVWLPERTALEDDELIREAPLKLEMPGISTSGEGELRSDGSRFQTRLSRQLAAALAEIAREWGLDGLTKPAES